MIITFGIINSQLLKCLVVGSLGTQDIKKLFEVIIKKTGQVNIMVRDVKGVDDNPFDFETVKENILEALKRI